MKKNCLYILSFLLLLFMQAERLQGQQTPETEIIESAEQEPMAEATQDEINGWMSMAIAMAEHDPQLQKEAREEMARINSLTGEERELAFERIRDLIDGYKSNRKVSEAMGAVVEQEFVTIVYVDGVTVVSPLIKGVSKKQAANAEGAVNIVYRFTHGTDNKLSLDIEIESAPEAICSKYETAKAGMQEFADKEENDTDLLDDPDVLNPDNFLKIVNSSKNIIAGITNLEGVEEVEAEDAMMVLVDASVFDFDKETFIPKSGLAYFTPSGVAISNNLFTKPVFKDGWLSSFFYQDIKYKAILTTDEKFHGYYQYDKIKEDYLKSEGKKLYLKDLDVSLFLDKNVLQPASAGDQLSAFYEIENGAKVCKREFQWPGEQDYTLEAYLGGVKPVIVPLNAARTETGDCASIDLINGKPLVAEVFRPTNVGLNYQTTNSQDFKDKLQKAVDHFSTKLNESIANYPADDQLYGEGFYHIINHELLPNEQKGREYLLLEHRLQYLKEAGIEVYLILDEVGFYMNPENTSYNNFATRVYQKTKGLKGKKAVLITVPYCYLDRFITGVQGQYVMPGVHDEHNLIDSKFSQDVQYKHIYSLLSSLYTYLPKPYREYAAFLNADGSVTYAERDHGIVAGKSCINAVSFYKKPEFDQIRNLPKPNKLRTEYRGVQGSLVENKGYEIEMFLYELEVLNILEQAKATPDNWEAVTTHIFKEKYIRDNYQLYALKQGFEQSGLLKWWTDVEISFASAESFEQQYLDLDKACYGYSRMGAIDPLVFGLIDLVSLYPGIDNFADGAGLVYAVFRENPEQMQAYAIGLTIVGVGTIGIKYGGKAAKFLYKGSLWIAEQGKNYQMLVKLEAKSLLLAQLLKVNNYKAMMPYAEHLHELIKAKHFSGFQLDYLLKETNEVERLAKLNKILDLELALKQLNKSQEDLLRADFHKHADLFDALVKDKKLLDSWKVLRTTDVGLLETFSILYKNNGFKKYYDDLVANPGSRKFSNLLKTEEEAVLKYYTTNPGYKDLNKALRGGEGVELTEEFIAQEKLMNKALDKLPNSAYNSPDKLLYRIENLTEDQIATIYKKGDNFTSKGFYSSTYSEDAIIDAMRNRNHTVLIRIKGKNGKLIEDLSTLPKEKEILFKSETGFKVENVGYSPNPDDFMTPIRTIWLTEL